MEWNGLDVGIRNIIDFEEFNTVKKKVMMDKTLNNA